MSIDKNNIQCQYDNTSSSRNVDRIPGALVAKTNYTCQLFQLSCIQTRQSNEDQQL